MVPILLLTYREAGRVVLRHGGIALRGRGKDRVPRVTLPAIPPFSFNADPLALGELPGSDGCGRAEALLRWLTVGLRVGSPGRSRAADQPRGREDRNENLFMTPTFRRGPRRPKDYGPGIRGGCGLWHEGKVSPPFTRLMELGRRISSEPIRRAVPPRR